MASETDSKGFIYVVDTTDPQSPTDFCVKCLTPKNKEIILRNKINIGICGIKDPKPLSSEISKFTYI